ncbi:nuclease [Prodigiosinella confusarubida]|uniref:Nuclease n=1 Tax=Serratia sp. (strain ATCC 39006) TaxID=104623 RepID=A0A2I5TDP6_SERS3|nr:AAA family ATPase [Serratia sp. ATCC 39006]AUG98366.1 nuclease [Serratia sp. ATCC 39006]AUH02681.1 nuclease [Serratia sp. ATCC 39006]
MAKMIPAFGPQDTNSYGEKTVYALLKAGLSNDFIIIHSLPWLSAAVKEFGIKLQPSGEIDFLILHPSLGVLVLEVKSGAYRVDRLVFIHIKSNTPVDVIRQARNNTHGLARWLGGATKLRLRIGYGFVFPDSCFDKKLISTAMIDTTVKPFNRIFIDKKQLPAIAKRIIDMMQYWKLALNNGELGGNRLKLIIKSICPQFDGTPSWGSRIVYDNQLWLRLTHEQIKVIELLSQNKRFIATGWPGTGKTLIGIEFARRLVREQKNVLFITFNNRLSDYIRQQTPDSLCDVFTWHKLCHQARSRLALSPNVPTDWFETGCYEDLLEALNNNKLKNYDVLIIDEAQALQHSWLETLYTWFQNKNILAFCDESQIFSFEKGTNHDELRQLINAQITFNLTIVLRSPKAVTDYLMTIRPTSYQLISPRNAEPDTLKELVVSDPLAAMINEILRLKESFVPSNNITVLVPTDLVKNTLQEEINVIGINIETVSRFRGMESPIVIALYSSDMEDAQLFCAYSRATTAFIAIYDSEKLAWKDHHSFLQQLISRKETQKAIDEAKYNSMTQSLMAGYFEEGLKLNTIKLSWSEGLSSWLISFGQENSPAETWLDYLYTEFPWPILYWFDSSHRTVHYINRNNFEPGTLENGALLSIKHCSTCKKMTPFISKRQCLHCNNKEIEKKTSPTVENFDTLRNLDSIISCNNFTTSENIQKRSSLPIPLAAVGARRVAFERGKRNKVLSEPLPGGNLLYRSALAFVQARIALLPPGKMLVLDEITDTLRKRYIHIETLDRSALRNALACALATCFTKKLLIKIEKGKYCIVDE